MGKHGGGGGLGLGAKFVLAILAIVVAGVCLGVVYHAGQVH